MTLSWPSDQFVPFARGDTRKPRRWGGQIVFGIETPDLYVLSVYESAFGDGVQHALNPLVQNRLRNMLKPRVAEGFRRSCDGSSRKAAARPKRARETPRS